MKHGKFLFMFSPLFAACVLSAAMPKDAVFFETENMTVGTESPAWEKISKKEKKFPREPSGEGLLCGVKDSAGAAKCEITLKKKGKYRFHLRYVDSKQGAAPFKVTLKQKWVVGEKMFGEFCLRSYPAMRDRFGDSSVAYVWDSIDFNGNPGKLTVTIEKEKTGKGTHVPLIDCFIVTSDLKYTAMIQDRNPIYARIRVLPEQKEPLVFKSWGNRLGDTGGLSAYLPRYKVLKTGAYYKNGGWQPQLFIGPGETTPWFEISRGFFWSGDNHFYFNAMKAENVEAEESFYEVEFASDPLGKNILCRAEFRGRGSMSRFYADPSRDLVLSGEQCAARTLKMIEENGDVPGRRPVLFPVMSTLQLSPSDHQSLLDMEFKAQAAIGINGGNSVGTAKEGFIYPSAGGSLSLASHIRNFCKNQMDFEGLDRDAKECAERVRKNPVYVNIQDEPGFSFSHVETCMYCEKKYADFLALHGKKDLELTKDPSKPEDFYWSMRYMTDIMTRYLRAGTDAVHKYRPDIPVTVNYSIEILTAGNMVARGCDWFEILRSGALDTGLHENYLGYCTTRQIFGYMADVMRAAAKKRGNNTCVYIIAGPQMDTVSFCEAGHGTKTIFYYHYGPYYISTGNASFSDDPDRLRMAKNFAYPTGAVDETLHGSRCARGDAAQLFSVTGDLMSIGSDSLFGKERMELNLLLRQAGIRIDFLHEDDLAEELASYKVLFASEAHMKRAALAPLLEWVRAGGTLYLTAGALRFDETGKELGLPCEREEFVSVQAADRPAFEMPKLKVLDEVRGVPVLAAYQKPFLREFKVGKGRIVNIGFLPGIGNIARAASWKDAMPAVELAKTWVKGRLRSGHNLVEAMLLENTKADLIVLANWTGETVETTIELDDADRYKSFRMIRSPILKQEMKGTTAVLHVKVLSGDYIECIRK